MTDRKFKSAIEAAQSIHPLLNWRNACTDGTEAVAFMMTGIDEIKGSDADQDGLYLGSPHAALYCAIDANGQFCKFSFLASHRRLQLEPSGVVIIGFPHESPAEAWASFQAAATPAPDTAPLFCPVAENLTAEGKLVADAMLFAWGEHTEGNPGYDPTTPPGKDVLLVPGVSELARLSRLLPQFNWHLRENGLTVQWSSPKFAPRPTHTDEARLDLLFSVTLPPNAAEYPVIYDDLVVFAQLLIVEGNKIDVSQSTYESVCALRGMGKAAPEAFIDLLTQNAEKWKTRGDDCFVPGSGDEVLTQSQFAALSPLWEPALARRIEAARLGDTSDAHPMPNLKFTQIDKPALSYHGAADIRASRDIQVEAFQIWPLLNFKSHGRDCIQAPLAGDGRIGLGLMLQIEVLERSAYLVQILNTTHRIQVGIVQSGVPVFKLKAEGIGLADAWEKFKDLYKGALVRGATLQDGSVKVFDRSATTYVPAKGTYNLGAEGYFEFLWTDIQGRIAEKPLAHQAPVLVVNGSIVYIGDILTDSVQHRLDAEERLERTGNVLVDTPTEASEPILTIGDGAGDEVPDLDGDGPDGWDAEAEPTEGEAILQSLALLHDRLDSIEASIGKIEAVLADEDEIEDIDGVETAVTVVNAIVDGIIDLRRMHDDGATVDGASVVGYLRGLGAYLDDNCEGFKLMFCDTNSFASLTNEEQDLFIHAKTLSDAMRVLSLVAAERRDPSGDDMDDDGSCKCGNCAPTKPLGEKAIDFIKLKLVTPDFAQQVFYLDLVKNVSKMVVGKDDPESKNPKTVGEFVEILVTLIAGGLEEVRALILERVNQTSPEIASISELGSVVSLASCVEVIFDAVRLFAVGYLSENAVNNKDTLAQIIQKATTVHDHASVVSDWLSDPTGDSQAASLTEALAKAATSGPDGIQNALNLAKSMGFGELAGGEVVDFSTLMNMLAGDGDQSEVSPDIAQAVGALMSGGDPSAVLEGLLGGLAADPETAPIAGVLKNLLGGGSMADIAKDIGNNPAFAADTPENNEMRAMMDMLGKLGQLTDVTQPNDFGAAKDIAFDAMKSLLGDDSAPMIEMMQNLLVGAEGALQARADAAPEVKPAKSDADKPVSKKPKRRVR